MRTKTHSFLQAVLCNNYDIIVLTETWLNSSVFCSELFDERYVVYRRDRSNAELIHKSEGGGVLVAISRQIHSKRMFNWESNLEDLWVIIDIPISHSLRRVALCVVYLPPPVHSSMLNYFIDNCRLVLDDCDCKCILGDFNLASINWNLLNDTSCEYKVPGLCQPLIDLINTYGLKQHNSAVNKSDRILDLVLSNMPTCIVRPSHSILSKIDELHPPLDVDISFEEESKLPFNDKSFKLNFHKADFINIHKELQKCEWVQIFGNDKDVNVILSKFYNIIGAIIEKFVPKQKLKKSRYPPWFNCNLKHRLKEKYNLRRRFQKYKNPMDELELQLLDSRCTRLAIDCYNKYISYSENNILQNPKYFWTYVKAKRGGTSSYPLYMTNGSVTASDGKQICEMFASYFASVYINNSTHNSDCRDSLEYMEKNSQFTMLPIIDSETLLRKLKSLDENKGAGPDGIPPMFIKRCAIYLVEPLLIIFNMSLQTGIFPAEWKKARVVPIHKADRVDLISNYRPISILSTLAKVLESLICPFVQFHFKQSLCIQQHGFVPSRSTCTNLVDLTENIAEALDSHKQVDVVYTDFSKAFDRLPHGLLMQKLSAYGISGTFFQWIMSYLENRTFSVVVNGFHSDSQRVTSGVPQGSHLGPILFTMFINDIPNAIKFSKSFLYADDLKLSKVIDTVQDSMMLQKDLDELVGWCRHNKMDLNPKKCFFVRYYRKRNIVSFQYSIAQNNIKELEQIRDLGVLFDRKLTFLPHI